MSTLFKSKSIDFVVPDSQITAGAKALTQVKTLTSCPDLDACPISSKARFTAQPASHMHIEATEVAVALYPQSETLWFLPALDRALSSPSKLNLPPCFVLASDQSVLPCGGLGTGSGFFKSEKNLVALPKSHILLEAFMRLYARDSGTREGGFSLSMIAYMEQYVDDEGYLDTKKLPEPFATFYRELRVGEKPIPQWTKELKDALKEPIETPEYTSS
ncbi:MAG: hypothetical protein Q9227_007206 [Pyrenula ochraceoflavens]